MMRFLWIICFMFGGVNSAPFDPQSDVASDSITTPPPPYVTDIWTETPPEYVTDFWTTEPQSTPACAEYDMRPDPNDPCKMCFCYSGQEICYMGFCMPAHCVNPQPSGCCMGCPDGPNCQVDDVVIPFGAKVPMGDGRVCSCEYTLGFWNGLSVVCEDYSTPEIPEYYTEPVPPSTTPATPADCIAEENPSLVDACQFCQCTNGRYECVYMDCARPSCPNPVREPGQCCGVCPDDFYTPEIPTTTPAEYFVDPEPSTPAECDDVENESLWNPCVSCLCEGGKWDCEEMPCPAVACESPVKEEGQCCGVCPPEKVPEEPPSLPDK